MARLHPFLVLAPVLTVAWAPAFAPVAGAAPEPRTLFGQPVYDPPELTPAELEARREAFLEGLERQGLVLEGNQVLPKSAVDPDFQQPVPETAVWEKPPHRATTFLNFFGGELKGGGNASEGESPCVQGTIKYPAYKGSEQSALAIIQIFVDAAKPFGMRIAYDVVPPKHLPYSQVMMGGRPGVIGLGNGVLGVACNLDCGDDWWRDTTFAFTEETSNVGILGTTALQEAAHAWGLDHIDGENNIMFPYATPGSKVWADTCTPYNDATGGIGCQYIHKQFCPDMDGQNDVAELNAFFGPDSLDTEPPVVVMMQPADGQQYTKGDMVNIEVEVSDNFEGFGWRLMVPELKQEQPVYNGQTKWELPAPPKGVYTIRVEAIDHDRNVGFAEAKIYVDTVPEGEGTTGDETATGETPTSGDAASEGSEAASDPGSGSSGDTSEQMGDGDEGCSCRSPAAGLSTPAWLLMLGGALGLRRRRRG